MFISFFFDKVNIPCT